MNNINHIHFTGIKGVGITPLAIVAKQAGFKVTGSDIEEEFITDAILKEAGITSFIGFSKDHIMGADLVISTGAHGGIENIEVKEAMDKKIKVIFQGQAVGEFMEGTIFKRKQIGISVAGSHGKTTTTAMIATVLKDTDPSYIVGTAGIPSIGLPGHFGKGEYFVAEADEYATEPKTNMTSKMLWQYPKIGVITNIEHDHPDIYSSIDDLKKVFIQFVQKNIKEEGIVIACIDNATTKEVLQHRTGKIITYGKSTEANYQIKDIKINDGKTSFILVRNDREISIQIPIIGEHNALNATAAVIAGLELGLEEKTILKNIALYKGSKRRLEFLGESKEGALIYDDYAHHPTEISKSLKAIKENYKDKKIIAVFQPHTYSRTKKLFNEFANSFDDSDLVLITDIYASLREQKDYSISSESLVSKISESKKAIYLPRLQDVIEYLTSNSFKTDSVIILMGAGDIYKIGEAIVEN